MQRHIQRDKLVGTMRFDFYDGEDRPATKWNPYLEITKEEASEIQLKINSIIFNKFNTFSSIIKECKGIGYDNTKVVYEDDDKFLYATKLIPVHGDYNGYVFIYRKDK